MAVNFVNKAASATEQASATSGSIPFDGTGCDFMVGFVTIRGAGASGGSANFNAVSMSQVPGSPWLQGTSNTIFAFILANPASGSHSFSASWTGSAPFVMGVIGVVGAAGTVSGIQTAGSNSAASISTTTPSTSAGLVVSATCNSKPAAPTLTAGTTDWSISPSGGSHQLGASSVATTWNISAADVILMVAFNIDAAPTPGLFDMNANSIFILPFKALGKAFSGWRAPRRDWSRRKSGLLVPAWQF